MKTIGKVFLYTVLLLVVVLVILVLALQSHGFQNKLVDKAAKWFSEKTETVLTVDDISIDFFTNLNLEGVLLTEQSGDTIAYLGLLQVDALDLLKPEKVIKNVQIAGAHIYLERNAEDGGYSIDKIISALGSSDSTSANTNTEDTAEPIKLQIQDVRLSDIRAVIKDNWSGQDQSISIGEAQIEIDSLDFDLASYMIKEVNLDGVEFALGYHTPSPYYEKIDKPKSDKPKPHLEVASLHLNDGAFKLHRLGVPPPLTMRFDPNDISIHKIKLDLDEVYTADNTIFANIRLLSAEEKSGLGIKNMRTKLQMSEQATLFSDAYIRLNQSTLKGQLKFNYGSIAYLSDFIEKVRMDIILKESNIASDDIAVFTNQLLDWDLFAGADLHFKGTVADYTAEVQKLYTRNGAKFVGRIAMKGLPDMDRATLNIHANQLETSVETVKKFAPQLDELEAVNLQALGNVRFVGDFVGRYLDFNIRGKLSSRNGDINIQKFYLDMLTPGDPKYGGVVDFKNINLYGFLPDLPIIKGHGEVNFDAVGTDPDKMYIDLVSSLENVHYDGTDYENIDLKGRATTNGLTASVDSRGEKVYGNFDLLFDMSRDYKIKVLGDFKKVDVQRMGFSPDPLTIRGILDADLAGDFTHSIIGYARLSRASIHYKDSILNEDFIRVTADTKDDEVYYAFETPFVQSSLDGRFMISDLIGMFQNVIYRYLPAYTEEQYAKMKPGNYANLEVQGSGLQKYLDIFIPELSLSDSVYLWSHVDPQNFELDGSIPFIKYNDYLLSDLDLNLMGDEHELRNTILSSEFVNDTEQLLNTIKLDATMRENKIQLLINTTDDQNNQNTLQSSLVADNDTFKFQLLPSAVFVNNKKWDIQSSDLSYLSGQYLNVAKTEIGNGSGKFVISSMPEANSTDPPLSIVLQEFDIRNVLDFLDQDLPDIQSTATGNLLVQNPLGDLEVTNNFALNNMEIEGQKIGDLNVDAEYKSIDERIEILNTTGLVYDDTYIRIHGDVLLDSTQKLGISMEASDYDIAPFEPFLEDFLSDLEGKVSGKLNVGGTISENEISGDMFLRKASFLITMMGNTYRLPEAHLSFDNNLFETDTTILLDEDDNIARLYGLISHENFDNLNFSIDLWSDKFRCLNTTAEVSEEVYGNVVAKLQALVYGSLEDIVLGLSIEPVQLSEITAVNVAGDAGGGLDGIEFRGIGDMVDSALAAHLDTNKIKLQLSAKVSPLLKATYILSQVDNSSITARGKGEIAVNYNIGDAEDLDPLMVFGGFEVTDGSIKYLNSNNFELSSIAGIKIFDIQEGTKVLLNGNPMQARITGGANTLVEVSNLEGMFTTEVLDEIKRSQPSVRNEIYKPQEVQIGVELQDASIEDVQNMEYKIVLPEIVNGNSEVNTRLAEINADQNEASKQVMSLLILNSFLSEDNMSTRMVLNSALGNTTNIFTSRISSSLNQTIKDVTNFDNLDVGLGLRFENDSSSLLNEQSLIPVVNFNGRLRILDDRLVLKVGYDINMANYGNNAGYGTDNVVTGDYKLEYKLDRGQDLEAYFYRNSSYDPLASNKGKINRAGLGLSFAVNFQNISEVFDRSKNRPKENPEKPKQ